jgi:hypothetical protein
VQEQIGLADLLLRVLRFRNQIVPKNFSSGAFRFSKIPPTSICHLQRLKMALRRLKRFHSRRPHLQWMT